MAKVLGSCIFIERHMSMKQIVKSLLLLFFLNGYGQMKVTPEDLKLAMGSWEGSITYLDYQTNNPFTMAANLIVEPGKNENSLILNNIYPNEPKANNSEKIKVTKKGTLLNKNTVTSRVPLENGQVSIQTEHEGKDDNKKAMIRYTYVFGGDTLILRKEIQFDASKHWIKRSEYNYQKTK